MGNMALTTKMFVGFGVVVALLVAGGLTGVFALLSGNRGFDEYDRQSSNAIQSATIQYIITEARRQGTLFLKSSSDTDKAGTEEHVDLALEQLADAKTKVKDPGRLATVTKLDEGMATYKQGFAELVAKRVERNTAYDEMVAAGNTIDQNLNTMMTQAEQSRDYQAGFQVASALRTMLLARLYVMKFLDKNAQEDIDRVHVELQATADALAKLTPTLSNPAQRQMCQETEAAVQQYLDASIRNRDAVFAEADIRATKLEPITQLCADIDNLKQEYADLMTKKSADTKEQNNRAMVALMVVVLVALVAAIIIAFIITRSIKAPITILAKAASIMSSGDYTVELHPLKVKDEIGQMTDAFIEMKNKTRDTIRLVAESATSVASSSEELSAGADETSKAIQQVATTVQEVAKGSQETTTSVTQAQTNLEQTAQAVEGVSKDIEDMATYATQAAAQGEEGRKAADNAVVIINQAARSVQDTTKVVHSLGDKTQRIAEFIGIITGIADQTNLLALNAAIEAARAGEAGRGFAVVAEEVRKLAEESNTAAGNITELVKSIEGEMATALNAMERSDKEVMEGAKTVDQTSQMLAEIVKGVQVINEKVQNISAAAEEINAQTGEVVDLMQSVASVAQENAAASEEVSSATEEQTASMEEIGASANTLAHLAQDLQQVVSKFKVD